MPPEIPTTPRWRRRLRELRRLVLLYGAWPTLRYLTRLVWLRLTQIETTIPTPPPPRLDFDERLGVTTEGIIETTELDTVGAGWIHSFGYEATPLSNLAPLLDGLDLDFGATTFLDLGAGKGRMLILALPLGFKRIVGVEIAPSLVEIAQHNLAALSPPTTPGRPRSSCSAPTRPAPPSPTARC